MQLGIVLVRNPLFLLGLFPVSKGLGLIGVVTGVGWMGCTFSLLTLRGKEKNQNK
jgi:hypothetical protein